MNSSWGISSRVARMRADVPLVQCITNTVVTQFTANVLLAAGASPAVVDTPEEAADFARVASGVLVNLGTPTAATYQAMREAVRGAQAPGTSGTPWVLDPVACGGAAARSSFAADIARHHPAAIRGNPSEIRALASLVCGTNATPTGVRGVDSTDAVESALSAATALAASTGAVVAVSGPRDLIVSVPRDDTATTSSTAAPRVSWLTSGSPMMQRVVGTGCSLGALTAAYLGAEVTARGTDGRNIDLHSAVVAAHAHVGAAGTAAADSARAPGSFAVAWLDHLWSLGPEDIESMVSLDEH